MEKITIDDIEYDISKMKEQHEDAQKDFNDRHADRLIVQRNNLKTRIAEKRAKKLAELEKEAADQSRIKMEKAKLAEEEQA